MAKILVLAITAVLLLTFSFSCGSTPSNQSVVSNNANTSGTSPKPTSPAAASAPVARKADFSVTAESVYQESKANKNAMDKYKGKVVEISGKFAGTSGSDDTLAVRFETSGTSIQFLCRLAPGTAGVVSKYEKGQDIKMTGVGDSFISLDGLGFKDCQPAP